MTMDLKLFREMLEIDSTSSRERSFAEFLENSFRTRHNTLSRYEVGDGTLNLLFSWGKPRLFFCSHLDTVPPYIPPVFENVPDQPLSESGMADGIIRGRGSCDAKGQVFSMFEACKILESEGYTDFALLLLSGEETGSFGAKAYTRDCDGGELVVVGEPTDNRQASAAKGTRAFEVTIKGRPCHSGYPENGESAVEKFVDFMERLREASFPSDPILGQTSWNVGKLLSDNPQNILSPELRFRIYFRTTFASQAAVLDFMSAQGFEYKDFGGDEPSRFTTFEGIPTAPVSFGSDAPQLHKFARKTLLGPGSILCAHTADEFVRLSELQTAVRQYVTIAEKELGHSERPGNAQPVKEGEEI